MLRWQRLLLSNPLKQRDAASGQRPVAGCRWKTGYRWGGLLLSDLVTYPKQNSALPCDKSRGRSADATLPMWRGALGQHFLGAVLSTRHLARWL